MPNFSEYSGISSACPSLARIGVKKKSTRECCSPASLKFGKTFLKETMSLGSFSSLCFICILGLVSCMPQVVTPVEAAALVSLMRSSVIGRESPGELRDQSNREECAFRRHQSPSD